MTMWNKVLLSLALLCTVSTMQAQDQQKEADFETWLSIVLSKRFDFDLDISLEQQVRLFEYSQTFTQVGLEYKALDFINMGGEMRFKFLKGGQTEYRLAAFIGLEAEKKDFTLAYRFKAQSNYSRFDDPSVTLRNKLTAKYSIKKDWRISSSFELFLSRQDDRFWLRKYRWMMALRYKVNKTHLVSVFYGIQKTGDLDLDDPIILMHIVGTRYDIRW